ncbi:hypothetical protein VNO80_25234 [Phaseolus coccineus]|uniref:Uncharacterized protein n=1 Tax=Phaseolus coccineus TaxID=3886 RepID=A0AAN9QNS6_PHACN
MHRIRENYLTTCAGLPVHSCEDKADYVRDFKILQDLHRMVEAQMETLFASKHKCLLVGTQHREHDHSPREGWQREGCVSDHSIHGAWSQPTTTSSLQLTHPRVRRTPHHETVHLRSLLASEQMETSSDLVSTSLGMEKNIRVACVHELLYPCSPSSNPYHTCYYSPRPPARMVFMEKPHK